MIFRQALRQLLVALFFLLPALVWAQVAATVVFATGSPTATDAKGLVRPLQRGAELTAGDAIHTADGKVQLRFADGASMALQPGTHFRIDAFRFVDRGNRASPGDGVVMSLVKGAMRTISGLLGKEDHSQYKVGTTVATIGIRGTEYGATMSGDGLSVTTYAGRVEVCSDVACQQIGPGETIWVYDRNEKPQTQPRVVSLPDTGAQPDLPQTPVVEMPSAGSPNNYTSPLPTNRGAASATSGK